MKLKNKKTGEIRDFIINKDKIQTASAIDCWEYNSLAELNEEWEDAPEEPKEYWYINEFGTPTKADFMGRETLYDKCRKNFGNYFETEEETEKAVEKLKAWKRLKDKGFKFIEGYLDNNDDFIIKAKLGHVGLIDQPDVHLLFGGEE